MKKASPKLSTLFWILSGCIMGSAIIAELLGMKIFSLGKALNLSPIRISFPLPLTIDFSMSVGIIIWPFVFVISDLVNEYFGRQGVKRISFFTAGMILFAFLLIYAGTALPGSDFWLQLNNKDPQGNIFNVEYAYSTIFRQSGAIIVGSITAFLLSQLVDATAFQHLKRITGHKKIWIRATGSTIISQVIDSFVILFIAFYLLGKWSFAQVIEVGVVQYFYKVILAIVLTPLIYWAHYYIDKYLGDEHPDLATLEESQNTMAA